MPDVLLRQPLATERVPLVSATVGAEDLFSDGSERSINLRAKSAGDRIKEGWPCVRIRPEGDVVRAVTRRMERGFASIIWVELCTGVHEQGSSQPHPESNFCSAVYKGVSHPAQL